MAKTATLFSIDVAFGEALIEKVLNFVTPALRLSSAGAVGNKDADSPNEQTPESDHSNPH